MQDALIQITGIAVLGIAMQWLGWRLRLPSILVLLLCGLALGPGLQLMDPDELIGHLLLPSVSLAVAIILFEGGLNLRLSELRDVGKSVRNLVTIGCLVTWAIGSVGAVFILGMGPGLAALFGAVLVVTGPTVTIPLIRHIRPTGRVGHVVKWEGIVNDPVGAMLAVLVYETVLVAAHGFHYWVTPLILAKTLGVGAVVGVLGTLLLILILRPTRLPDYLHMHASLAMVLLAFTLSNVLQSESGLVAVTLMGIAMANQRRVSVRHLIEFKENLRVLLLSVLFIVLGARLHRSDIAQLAWGPSFLYLALLIFVARPLAVLMSTWTSKLSRREKLFLSFMAPRGVVAAAVASVFALELAHVGYPDAERLVPYTFLVVIGTVAFYGLAAAPLARRLGLGHPNPQGVVLAGAHPWARDIAKALKDEGVSVLLVDTNWDNVSSARMAGLPAHYGSIISEYIDEEIDLAGMGRLLALTSNDEANALAALHFSAYFGRAEVYQLAAGNHSPRSEVDCSPLHLRGRTLFGPGVTYGDLTERFRSGAAIRRTALTKEFDFEAFRRHYGDRALPLFVVSENGHVSVFSEGKRTTPHTGQKVISLIDGAADEQK